MNETPVLETERLVLRGWRESDLDPIAAMMAEPEVARFLTADGRPQDRAATWRGMAMMAGHWALHGFGMFVVEEKSSGHVTGRVGVWRPEGWVGHELGWGLAPDFWGKGYAHEAARAAGDWAFSSLPIETLVSLIDVQNVRSQALARKFGMSPGRETLHVGLPHIIWEIGRADWTRA